MIKIEIEYDIINKILINNNYFKIFITNQKISNMNGFKLIL
ncbi:hypothetical protein UT300002_32560 [Clostridium perfringens]